MDQKLFRKTFDQVHMPAERSAEIREMLAGRCTGNDWEVKHMKNSKKKTVAAFAAVCTALALSVTAFASGGVLERVFQMMSGPAVQQGVREDGSYYFKDGGEETTSPVELREDGRLYLTVNGEDRDITEECSYETPYIYTCTGEDGLEHTFIIGGEPGNTGWVEYADAEDTDTKVSEMVIDIPGNTALKNLPWLNKGLQQTKGVTLEQLPYQVSGEENISVSAPEESTVYGEDGQSSQVITVSIIKNQD